MGVEHDISDCTFDELWEELASRCECAMLVHEKPEKVGKRSLVGMDWKGSVIEGLGLLAHARTRLAKMVTDAMDAAERDMP